MKNEGSVTVTTRIGYESRRFRYHSSHDEIRNSHDVNDFVLSLLQAGPSARDSKKFLASFGGQHDPKGKINQASTTPTPSTSASAENSIVSDVLSHRARRPALVKIQGPFTDAQLDSVAKGLAYLQKLGLVSVIVVDRDDIALDRNGRPLCGSEARRLVLREMERTVSFLAKHRAPARPIISTVIRSRRIAGENETRTETYVEEEGLAHVRRAVEEGEIPVLIPVALDQGCKTNLMEGNDVVRALAESMGRSGKDYAAALVAENGPAPSSASSSILNEAPIESPSSDMTPLRLLIINREGGIPSYARAGMPHLSINLETEYDFIQDTFLGQWETTHPSALANLTLARDCLAHMPSSASALIASHKSPAALIANLITNKPAHSASLPHALLAEGEGKITPHTPTLIRKGMPIRIIRSFDEIDRPKLRTLLERSFGRTLNEEAFWSRMARSLDFAIVAGDYAAAALCTNEGPSGPGQTPICYLDKFAVLPSHQGDGTVDFLWVALRDETFGLGLKDAANANIGSLAGVGSGRDLIWRSRADNPVNKWYYERSNGFVTLGNWKMFWCDAEQRIRELKSETGSKRDRGIPIKVVEDTEQGRLLQWASYVEPIPSAWS
ncbi:hypothetical protein FFLO_00484 [Filobasidium floriforme]|uniref:Amino-acid acetyltransferase, mitochondrial n=1 Tax=Filobasidium floriforme TaxID=5210 RepID=A0A8K0JRY7_9TREE|nr:mitochondrial amino-acid acetyltransferase [Filobasidium floriforme]KAG7575320.1 hypothetical protein FFLO_00484 [Filobasidium floriforme]KAH8078887.1 mitochondrial amino-acid acetyltransferase [Filobasidium floriforme]